ncbi:zwei Ig domain protein zig-8-like [Penaeus monodon]|uniref:zwei Ig domain protein zig-8-like n=1 Tax=Penaeus monodon TaxID=6687 RepID=UPI0018A728B9|nr:zwei Ig domain protein zig-8-like [Penaeus monodon]
MSGLTGDGTFRNPKDFKPTSASFITPKTQKHFTDKDQERNILSLPVRFRDQQNNEDSRHSSAPTAWCAILDDQVGGHQQHQHNSLPPFVDILPPGPFFDIERSGNVTALVGRPAKLNCRVNKIGNRTVSWLRHRDTHLLTVGRYTYTSDQRFRAVHTPGSEDWALTVDFAQSRDSGMYECQVSTTPPMRHYIWLKVVEPETHIFGGPDIFINNGSNINLTCVVEYTPEPPTFIIWKHNDKVITYDSDRGGVSVVTEKGPRTTTNLLVRGASAKDSGTYTCNPSSAPLAKVIVHILNGEHPAAMQHGGHSPYEVSAFLLSFAFAFVVAFK